MALRDNLNGLHEGLRVRLITSVRWTTVNLKTQPLIFQKFSSANQISTEVRTTKNWKKLYLFVKTSRECFNSYFIYYHKLCYTIHWTFTIHSNYHPVLNLSVRFLRGVFITPVKCQEWIRLSKKIFLVQIMARHLEQHFCLEKNFKKSWNTTYLIYDNVFITNDYLYS